MSETYTILSLGCYLFAGIMFTVGLGIFFGQNIPRVIRELNGKLAKEEIEQMRIRSEKEASKQMNGILDYTAEQKPPTGNIQKVQKLSKPVTSGVDIMPESTMYRSGGTTVLGPDKPNPAFAVYKSEIVIHTNEYIKEVR